MLLQPSRTDQDLADHILDSDSFVPNDDERGEQAMRHTCIMCNRLTSNSLITLKFSLRHVLQQAVWQQLYRVVTELPAAFSAFKSSRMSERSWASSVLVVHDVNLYRKGNWGSSVISSTIADLNAAASTVFAPVDAEVRAMLKTRSKERTSSSKSWAKLRHAVYI